MKKIGDRVRVVYPHEPYYDSNLNRVGTLVKVTQQVPCAEEGMRDIWEVQLDARRNQPEILKTYNEYWLHKVVTYEEWKQNPDGQGFINWESLNQMTTEEAGELYDGLLETFAPKQA